MRQSVNECTNHSDNLNSGRGRDNGRGSRLQEQRCSRSARFLDTEPSASAQRFFSYCASLGICEITIFGVQITSVFVCNETCVLKHVAFRISPLSRLSHEIFGFRTHSPSVNIVVFPDVEQTNSQKPSVQLNGRPTCTTLPTNSPLLQHWRCHSRAPRQRKPTGMLLACARGWLTAKDELPGGGFRARIRCIGFATIIWIINFYVCTLTTAYGIANTSLTTPRAELQSSVTTLHR
jgi:hypothetical protein